MRPVAPAPATVAEPTVAPVVEKTSGYASPRVVDPTSRQPRQPRPPQPVGSAALELDAPETVTRQGHASQDDATTAARLTAHVGVGAPLVTLRASRSTRHVGSVNQDFTLVAPLGLGMMLTDHWTFDFELQVSTGVRPEGLTTAIVDPGVLYARDRLVAGLRVAWQLNANQNAGLVPLLRAVVLRNARASWFVEAAFPAFVQNKQITASASLQTGVGF